MRGAQQLESACLQTLCLCQLPDGGWPFTAGANQTAVEPTALACLALPPNFATTRSAAIRCLLHLQNPNGSWPAFPDGDERGSGYTGLALYALNRSGEQGLATSRAVNWLLDSQGWEAHWLWKWKFRTSDRHVRFDPDKFGWPWMPETVSWVVPTAYALVALKHVDRSSQVDSNSQKELLAFRVRRGLAMLYDRICPGGGWNAGNGVVYGFPLAPHPDATAAALLALSGEPLNDFIATSLAWLECRAGSLFAPWSLAWTVLALDAFRRPTQPCIERLCGVVEPAGITDCATLAVVCLALHCSHDSNAFGGDS